MFSRVFVSMIAVEVMNRFFFENLISKCFGSGQDSKSDYSGGRQVSYHSASNPCTPNNNKIEVLYC